jgi:hypothetical protein
VFRYHYRLQANRALSDARQTGTILSSDPPEIVAALIPLIDVMLVLLLVYNARATDQGLVRRIYNLARYAQRLAIYWGTTLGDESAKWRDIADGKSQMIDGVAISCAQPENCKSYPASSASAEAVL